MPENDTALTDLPQISSAVAGVLRQVWGRDIRIAGTELVREGGRNLVARCTLVPDDAPLRSVVAKVLRRDVSLGLTDWACLRFLGRWSHTAQLAPRLIGGDTETRMFVMEDLGGSGSFESVLHAGTPDSVRATAVALAEQTARLQGNTAHAEGAFLDECHSLGGAQVHARVEGAERWRAALPRVHAWLDAVGVPTLPGFREAIENVAVTYAEPGEWLAFTHGDPAPTNNHVTGGPSTDVRLLDFEYGGYRHALYDISAWCALCPLPEELEAVMRTSYRATLAEYLPIARDVTAFHQAWATVVAYRALAILTWIPLSVLEENHTRVGEWTARESLICTAERLRDGTLGVAGLEPIAEAGEALATAFRRRWSEYGEVRPTWGYEAA
jgi:hypothetical protein